MPADQPTLPHATTAPPSPSAVALIDSTLRIRQATPEFAALAGMPAADLPGLPAALLIPEAAPAFGPLLAAALASGEPSHDVAVSAPDGRRWLATLEPIRSQAGAVLGVDLLLRRHSGQTAPGLADSATFSVPNGRHGGTTLSVNAEQAARQMARLQALTAALSRALTPEAVAGVVIENGLAAMGAMAGTVMQLDPGGATMSILATHGFGGTDLSRWEQLSLTAATPISDAVRRGEPVWLENLAARARLYPHLDREFPYRRERAWAALPLAINQRTIGAIGLIFDEARAFDADAQSVLATVAELCAQALERARLSAAERNALAAADEALALLDTVIDSAPIGLAFMDTEFRYRRVNATLAQLNGLPAAEHIGRLARDLFPRGAAIWEPYWRQVLESGEPIIGLELGGPAMGIDRYALVDYYPVRSPGGELLGVGIIVQDITGRRQAEQERQELLEREQAARGAEQAARARAEEAVQLRDTFLSVAAHELKTPLTALLGQAQLLRRRLDQAGALNEANERSLGVVVGQAQRLNQLINDLLDGARLEAGQLIVNRAPLDLGGLIRQAADDLRHSLVRHQLVVTIEDEPLVIAGDGSRLEQVVQNLLNNAMKYSPSGGVVGLRVARDGDAALLAVSDEGIGIEEAALPRLFERFYRAPGAERAKISGVGVGLYVVREIVRQHGGTIAVESAVGKGTTIRLRLPLDDG